MILESLTWILLKPQNGEKLIVLQNLRSNSQPWLSPAIEKVCGTTAQILYKNGITTNNNMNKFETVRRFSKIFLVGQPTHRTVHPSQR